MAELFERVTGVRVACADYSRRGLVIARGTDRIRFLNGMISNDVEALETGAFCYATLLDRKGHVLADLDAVALEHAVWLSTAEGRGPLVWELLEKHLIADDVVLENRSTEEWGEWTLEGPDAKAWLEARGHPRPEAGHAELDRDGRLWLGGGLLGPAFGTGTGVRVIGAQDGLPELFEACPRLAPDAAEVLRVERALPRYGVDVTDRNFPQEARLESAVSFDKGCYIGQEIVARLHSRGAINRALVRISLDAPTVAGAEITADGVRVGSVTSAVVSPVSGPLALGYVRTGSAAAGTRLEVGGTRAEVAPPE